MGKSNSPSALPKVGMCLALKAGVPNKLWPIQYWAARLAGWHTCTCNSTYTNDRLACAHMHAQLNSCQVELCVYMCTHWGHCSRGPVPLSPAAKFGNRCLNPLLGGKNPSDSWGDFRIFNETDKFPPAQHLKLCAKSENNHPPLTGLHVVIYLVV